MVCTLDVPAGFAKTATIDLTEETLGEGLSGAISSCRYGRSSCRHRSPSRLRLPFHRSKSSHGADPSPFSFTLVHVIPRQGHAVQLSRELRLKNHQTAVAECQFTRGEVEFPHAAKPLIVNPTILSLALHKALTPMTKRLSIVQAQDFQVGENQARTLDDRRDLRESGNVPSREDVLACPCTRDGRAIACGLSNG